MGELDRECHTLQPTIESRGTRKRGDNEHSSFDVRKIASDLHSLTTLLQPTLSGTRLDIL